MIPFNKPSLVGNELKYIKKAFASGHVSGDGVFTKKCQDFFEKQYGFKKVLLTTSCTDALEMAALLIGIEPGDEVIAPSFTFVSSVNPFLLRGCRIVFADSLPNHPNIDPMEIEHRITKKTKAIVVVHYGGVGCDMDRIMKIAKEHKLFVIEDAAHSLDAYYKEKPLGSFGHLSAFSFHETKNITSGEGGMLVINDKRFLKRAEIIREKGTNRSAFFRGEVNKYGWVDIGSSFLPSEITAAFLYAQIEKINMIQKKRKVVWERYIRGLKKLADNKIIQFFPILKNRTNNAHVFPLFCRNEKERNALLLFLKKNGVHATFHYLPLHKSTYYKSIEKISVNLPNATTFANTIIRLPLYSSLRNKDQQKIIKLIQTFFI